MRVLFIGGTGKISSACSQLAVDRGIELYLLNRGQTTRPVPSNLQTINGDIRSLSSAREALGDLTFDAVVNWIAFTPEHIHTDLELFRGRTKQYVFISSASAYQKPIKRATYHRINLACQPLLGIFAQQDCLRRNVGARLSRGWLPLYHYSSLPHLRPHHAPL